MQNANPLRQLVRNRTVVKIVGTTLLTLVLLIPLSSIESLVEERSERKEEVIKQLAKQWGPSVTIRGPILAVPTKGSGQHQYFVPDDLEINGTVPVVERYRGIFRLPTYRGQLELSGTFRVADELQPADARVDQAGDAPDADAARGKRRRKKADREAREDPAPPREESKLDWNEASWLLLIDPIGTPTVQARLSWGKSQRENLETVYHPAGLPVTALSGDLPEGLQPDDPMKFVATLQVMGSGALHIAPLGKEIRVALESDWPHPSFDGDRLPSDRVVEPTGFQATWELNAALLGLIFSDRGEPVPGPMLQSAKISVRFVDAVSHYQQVTRGVKYALLIIVLTFVSFFLFEILARLDIHPIQYLLVGCALTIFYLLLLSLTEHLPFSWSYLIAAAAVVTLITGYARAMLGARGRAALSGLGLGSVYGLLYVILREERLALLAGSWALFALLALVMFLTRNIDWRSLGAKSPTDAASPTDGPTMADDDAGR